MTLAEKIRHLPVTREKTKGRHGLMKDPFEEMDRLFERLLGRSMVREWMHPAGWPFGFTEDADWPRVDVLDREDTVVVRAEMPGVAKKDLDISLGDDTVTLRGTVSKAHEKEEEEYYYKETASSEFVRTVRLPTKVDGSKAKATYEDGIVRLELPKAETAKRQKIQIN